MPRKPKDKSNEYGFGSKPERNAKEGAIFAEETLNARDKALRLLEEVKKRDESKVPVQVKPGTWILIPVGANKANVIRRFKEKTGIKEKQE